MYIANNQRNVYFWIGDYTYISITEREAVQIIAVGLRVAPRCVDWSELARDIANIFDTYGQTLEMPRSTLLALLSWAVVTDDGSLIFDAARTLDFLPIQAVFAI